MRCFIDVLCHFYNNLRFLHLIFVLSDFSTIWYELQVRNWPITDPSVEAKIWLIGSNKGIKKVLADANLGKEVTVSV